MNMHCIVSSLIHKVCRAMLRTCAVSCCTSQVFSRSLVAVLNKTLDLRQGALYKPT